MNSKSGVTGGAGIGDLLRSGFDAGIGRETVVQMGGGNPELKTELQGNGWRKGKKMLTPLQVRTIVQYLGEP